ncbi:MAG: ComEC/Rec2 family competence protein [Patescibacteria group bacterium]
MLIAATVLLVIFWSSKKLRILSFALIFLVGGILRFNLSFPKSPIFSSDLLTQKMEIKGLVYEEPEESDLARKIKIKIVEGPKELIGLKILVINNLQPAYDYGDLLKIYGKIEKPEKIEDFDYPAYLARFKIYLVSYKSAISLLAKQKGDWLLGKIYLARSRLKEIARQGLPEPETSVFQAMVLGEKEGLNDETRQDFSRVGLSHIMAISGLHISIVAGLLMNLALGFGLSRKQAFWAVTLALIIFIVLIGLPASAVRAGIMGFLVLWAMYLGRLNRSANALVLAAALMLLINPELLRYDVGFQLSFLAVLGLIYVLPYFERLAEKLSDRFKIKSMILMTLSAQVFTLPLIVYYFKIVSLISPLANVLVLPLLPLVLITGFSALILAFIFGSVSMFIFWPVYFFLKYITQAANILASIKGSFIMLNDFDPYYLPIIYLFIFTILIIVKKCPGPIN